LRYLYADEAGFCFGLNENKMAAAKIVVPSLRFHAQPREEFCIPEDAEREAGYHARADR
jgi:hypothetical protein